MNLTKLVREPFTPRSWFDFDKLEEVVPVLVRMLDNVLDLTTWPLPEQRREAQAKRRIGIGITGLGDALIMLGLKYSSVEGREFARRVMERIRDVAYLASVELAKERGAFPLFDADRYLEEGTFASRLPADIMQEIWKHGIRNSHLLSLAPTGTGSLTFGNNCSSGCEPVFDFVQMRKIKQSDGSERVEEGLMDYAYLVYRKMGGDAQRLPDTFESVATLKVADHLEMLKVLAPYVDAAISKTVNVPADYPKTLDGLCKLLSIDMRIIDPAWIGMKLRKLTSYKEPQGDFLARVPGSEKQANFTSTAAYMARLLIHRYHQLGLLNEDGTVETKNSFLGSEAGGSDAAVRGSHVIAGKRCPECGVDAVVKYNGCDKCTNCGYVGSCG